MFNSSKNTHSGDGFNKAEEQENLWHKVRTFEKLINIVLEGEEQKARVVLVILPALRRGLGGRLVRLDVMS